MRKNSASDSIDAVRAKFANATQTFWVCPVTQKTFPSDDQKAIAAHQTKVIKEMEGKEKAKERQKVLRVLNSELGKIATMDELRAWALRRVQLDVENITQDDMPAMSAHMVANQHVMMASSDVYIRLAAGKALTAEIKSALGARAGKSLHALQVGKGMGAAWFMSIPASSPLGRAVNAWTSRRAKKLSMAEKEALADSNEQYRADQAAFIALGAQIHALREQARAVALRCEQARNNALTVLPQALQ